ncbi:MAG TPA: hypothetical protein VM681_00265 [Candidatus Thermoplasmatota archaeon]|nr:hypothetical protein [Candidatus Thermoplasmatota archaeon]
MRTAIWTAALVMSTAALAASMPMAAAGPQELSGNVRVEAGPAWYDCDYSIPLTGSGVLAVLADEREVLDCVAG